MKSRIAGANNRQKIILGLFAVVGIFVAWQVYDMMGFGTTAPAPEASLGPVQPMPEPKMADITQVNTVPPAQLAQQQALEARYIVAMNRLQMLRLDKEIADADTAIAKAKLETITTQKSILDILTAKPSPNVLPGQSMNNREANNYQPKPSISFQNEPTPYAVVSISQIQHKWRAVVSYQGSLFQVMVGDYLPVDQSKVIEIDNDSITLEKNGNKRKLSLVPVI